MLEIDVLVVVERWKEFMLQLSFGSHGGRHIGLAHFLILASAIWAGCSTGAGDDSLSRNSTDAPDALAPAPPAPTLAKAIGSDHAAADVATGFGEFWMEFRRAALDGNTVSLLRMTELPFGTRGPTDADPVVEHDSAAFIAVLPRLLAADPGLSPQPTTMRKLLEDTQSPPSSAVDGNEARVGEFVFVRRAGRWRFARAYLSDSLNH